MAWYITKLIVDSPWPGGGGFFVGFRGGEAFFGAVRGGKHFFCPPDVVFISDDHVINATSLSVLYSAIHFWYILACYILLYTSGTY